MNEPILDRPAGETGISLGKRLAKARKARGWTLGYVASQLHLPESTIDALEADDYSRLPAEVYVKGYLRNYARLLRLPADEIIQAYLEQHAEAAPSGNLAAAFSGRNVTPGERRTGTPTPLIRGAREMERGQKAPPHHNMLRWVGTALVVAYAATWLWPDSRDQGVMEWLAEIRSDLSSPPVIDHNDTVNQQEELTPSDSTSEEASPLPTSPEESATGAVETTPLGRTASEEAATTGAPQGLVSSQAAADTLHLRFDADSWATVVDADGKRLLHQTGTKGTTKTLTGKAPFNLTIGRIADVSIEFNGRPFEFPNAKKRATERFSIPFSPKDQQRLSVN